MARILSPLDPLSPSLGKFSVFLAGSIGNELSVNWRFALQEKISDLDIYIFNPILENRLAIGMRGLSTWEMDGITIADVVVFNFLPGTLSQISLFELGLCSGTRTFMGPRGPENVIVLCPEEFSQKERVDIVCERFKLTQVSDLDSMAGKVRQIFLNSGK